LVQNSTTRETTITEHLISPHPKEKGDQDLTFLNLATEDSPDMWIFPPDQSEYL